MSASLRQIQTRLEAHFRALAQSRAGAAPIFALEHDLSEPEYAAMAEELSRNASATLDGSDLWLVWIVYAAELGYDFEGDEYWQSFEKCATFWRSHGDRNQVRSWFHRFHMEFGGIRPSGVWARHRTIISWPITNAILPLDLQREFAETLYYARHNLAAATSTDPEELGRLIRSEAWHTSSRFQQFVEQEALVGRLVLALLGAEEAEGDRIIRPDTLHRIIADLERHSEAKAWLDGTRRTVVKFKGANAKDSHFPRPGAPSPISPRPSSVRPTILLRRKAKDEWAAYVDVPTLADVASRSDEVRSFIRRTRSTINGGSGVLRPSSWLLGAGGDRPLHTWPNLALPIVQFERPHQVLDRLLHMEGTLSKGPVWPCRIREDGSAAEVLGRQVRPGQRYVLLYQGELTKVQSPLLRPNQVDCGNVEAVQLDVPESPNAAQETLIENLGLKVCKTIRLWPAGLGARRWDGEGRGEWLTTERPCFGIAHSLPVDFYLVSLDSGPETRVVAPKQGQALFITLPELDLGEHLLRVRAVLPVRPSGGGQKEVEGTVALSIRSALPWAPGSTAHGGLAVITEPSVPELDDLIADRLGLQIFGPAGRHVEVTLKSVVPAVEEPLLRRCLPLPVSIHQWSRVLTNAAAEDLAVASRAEIVVSGDELGTFRISLERDAAPLRWIARHVGETTVRLVDEAGEDAEPSVCWASFESPIDFQLLDAQACRDGLAVEPPGGLFRVSSSAGVETIIVRAKPRGHVGLSALGVAPQLTGPHPACSELLDLIRLWSRTRAVGPLAPQCKAKVVETLTDAFYQVLCGLPWITDEQTYRHSARDDVAAITLSHGIGHHQDQKSFAAVLRRSQADLTGLTARQRADKFADLAYRYGICRDGELSQFALQMATEPASARDALRDAFDAKIAKLHGYGALVRGARLLALNMSLEPWRW